MKFAIKHWISGKILFTAEVGSLKLAVEAAVKQGADLEGADLEGADLEGADLKGAYLKGAYLKGADLEDADLEGAYLKGAYLKGAYLKGAYLEGADLKGAYFEGAYLEGADKIPVVENIDKKIWEIIKDQPEKLAMGNWHTCATTHCRAGWAIHLAGKEGYELEKKLGSHCAGFLIYKKSRPGERAPDFYASDEDAFESIRNDALETPNAP